MAKYAYVGWGPEVDPEGAIVRPFDEREFDEQPAWGRWALADAPPPETDEGGQPPGLPGASPVALSAAPALSITPPATPEGM